MKKYLLFWCLVLIYSFSYAQVPQIDLKVREEMIQRKAELYQQMMLCEQQKTPNQDDYDVKYYLLDLTPDPTISVLTGTVEIVAEVVANSLDYIELNFMDNMTITNVYMSKSPDSQLNYLHNDNIINIDLDAAYSQGEQFSVVISYYGLPRYGFAFNSRNAAAMIWTLSQPFGARAWWPCKDVPSDKADSVDIRVTVPNRLIVASNGSLRQKIVSGENVTYWWHEKYPIVTYLVSLAIHPYKVSYDNYLYNNDSDTMKIHFYVFPDHYDEISSINLLVKDMITCFAGLYGEYPFVEEKYGHADFLGGGAMEHQTCTSFGFWNEAVYAHELAHQWWGDLITCDSWHHIWLNEGFATYSEALWFEHAYQGYSASEYQMTANLYLGSGTVYVEDPENEVIFHGGLSYNKGSWVLHMLRHVVGDDVFFNILKTYYASPNHRYGTATTEDFQALSEQVSGMDLEKFFHQWIYEEWYPHYSFYWLSEDLGDGNYKVLGIVNQIQTEGPIFEMPVDLTIQTVSGDTTVVLFSDEQSEYYEYVVNSQPTDVFLDRDNWVLKRVSKIDRPILSVTNYYIDDSTANNNNYAEPGETVNLIIEIKNSGLTANNVNFTLKTDDSDINIIDGNYAIAEIGLEAEFCNEEDPFVVSISTEASAHLSEFRLCFTADLGQSDSLSLFVPIGIPNILFVDDDDGLEYENFIKPILNENRVLYDVWEVQRLGIPELSEGHNILIWSTGDDRVNTLTHDEQALLTTFLDNGGKLLLNGQNIGYDLVEDGSIEDSLFYTNYLHAQYIMDSADDAWVVGVSGDPIGSQVYAYFEGQYGGADNQNSTDVIEPIDPAISCFYYAIAKHSAGIHYEDQATGNRVVYLPFGLEGISGPSPNSASMLIERIMIWLSGSTGINNNEIQINQPDDYHLYSNYPNPFNPETVIKFNLPEKAKVSLKIYNLLGQEIITLVNEIKPAGAFEVIWSGNDNFNENVTSGIYLYRLETNKFKCTHKMLLLR